MIKKLILLVFIALLASCDRSANENIAEATPVTPAITLPEGVSLVEEFSGDDDGFSIAFSKYKLDNGLTVVLHEDHSDPMVHVDVTYHVGSAREEQGRSGFAHFF